MTREHFTASLFFLLLLSAWILGFWHPWIHAALGGFAVVVFGLFPIWIVEQSPHRTYKPDEFGQP